MSSAYRLFQPSEKFIVPPNPKKRGTHIHPANRNRLKTNQKPTGTTKNKNINKTPKPNNHHPISKTDAHQQPTNATYA
jgi:hypothetical protein